MDEKKKVHLFRIPSINLGKDHLVAAATAEEACRALAEARADEHYITPKTVLYLKREPVDMGEHQGKAGVVAINKGADASQLN